MGGGSDNLFLSCHVVGNGQNIYIQEYESFVGRIKFQKKKKFDSKLRKGCPLFHSAEREEKEKKKKGEERREKKGRVGVGWTIYSSHVV